MKVTEALPHSTITI